MDPNILSLVSKKIQYIMESTPSAWVILSDPCRKWDIIDFSLVWANDQALKLMPMELGENIQIVNNTQLNGVRNHFKMLKYQIEKGQQGFSGPYPYTTINDDGDIVHLEFSIMFLGCVDSRNYFAVLTHDKTADVFNQELAAKGYRSRKKLIDRLSDREKAVAKLVVEGLKSKQIAEKLGVSSRTVDNHRANIRKKMNLTDRTISISECLSIF